MSLREKLDAMREAALSHGIPARRKDADLYRLLAGCLDLCEQVQRDGLGEELREAVRVSVDERDPAAWGQGRAAGNAGRGRRYANTTTDEYVLVARYVLEGHDTRNSIYRYAKAMRQAHQSQVRAADLVQWLEENGGIYSLTHGQTASATAAARRDLERAARLLLRDMDAGRPPAPSVCAAIRGAIARIDGAAP